MKSTNSTERSASRARQLAREHALVRKTIGRIQAQLERAASGGEEPGRRPDLLRSVRALGDQLARHFRLEEAGGLLGGAVQYYGADARRTAGDLVAQHRDFERRLGRLRAGLERDARGGAGLEPLAADLRALLRDLASHERAETALFESAIRPGAPSI